MSTPRHAILRTLAQELSIAQTKVDRAVELLSAGNSVPFIARYRKEATGNLDEVQIRRIEERHQYLLDLNQRRETILQAIDAQGKLDPRLREAIERADSKTALEDLYLPYKKKRRTRAASARERGLEPLAERILAQPADGHPQREAARFVDTERDVPDAASALAGARDIIAEIMSERRDVRAALRSLMQNTGQLVSRKSRKSKKTGPSKFEQYYDFQQSVKTIPSHRYLAISRGESEDELRASVQVDDGRARSELRRLMRVARSSPWSEQLLEAIDDGYKRLLLPSLETEMRGDLKGRSDEAAVDVFAENLRHLLMAAPLGTRAVVGIDPGLRTGCKCAAVDSTGKFIENLTIYPSRGEADVARSRRQLGDLLDRHRPFAIAVGNGTGGRETESFVRAMLKERGGSQPFVVSVSEAGASVYSASDLAREEFPELDLTVRGAISIARRLQDPLAELVKVEPKAIGVGQYQHDVQQSLLERKLGEVVESCVNRVGVELNTASASLLAYVAGIGPKQAAAIVAFRESSGAFERREQLLGVPGVGARTFEQCAGFLRIEGSPHPLDRSAVHPERYALVQRMARDLDVALSELVGNSTLVERIPLDRYRSDEVGEPTLRDIVEELKKPGRDPRAKFEPPTFRDDVHSLEDLRVDMVLQGVVTNVTAFGAFVDVGVHQDGLVHISELADRFVRDPSEVVRVGDKLSVRVLSVDLPRKRISLSARKR